MNENENFIISKDNQYIFSPIFNIFRIWKYNNTNKKQKIENNEFCHYKNNYSIINQFLCFMEILPFDSLIKQRLQKPLFIRELEKLQITKHKNNEDNKNLLNFDFFVHEKEGIERSKINTEKIKDHIMFVNNLEDLNQWITDSNDPYIKKRNQQNQPCIYKEDCICKYLFGKENGFICIAFNPNNNKNVHNNDENNNSIDNKKTDEFKNNENRNKNQFYTIKQKGQNNNNNFIHSHMCIIDQIYHTIAVWWHMKQNAWNPTETLILQKMAIQKEKNNQKRNNNISCFVPLGPIYDGIIFPFPFIFPHDVVITGQFVKKIQIH